MAKYNVVFTIKDKYGHEKELVGGTIEVDLNDLTSEEVSNITDVINLDEYVTDIELADAIKDRPTVEAVKDIVKTDVPTIIKENKKAHQAVTNVVETHVDTIKYGTFGSSITNEEDCCDV